MNNQTKPKYLKNSIFENSWNIEYSNGKIYIVDEHVFEKILNFNKKFIFKLTKIFRTFSFLKC